MSLVQPVWLVVTFPNRTHSAAVHFAQLPTRRIFTRGWQWQCHIMRYPSLSVGIALAIQNAAESFVLQLPIANSISRRPPDTPDNCCRFSIRQIVAQTMQDGASY